MSRRIVSDFTDFGNRKWIDRLPGGKADGKEPNDFESDDIEIGSAVEREHSSNPDIATEVAMDHLEEDPEYYDKLLASGIADEKEAKDLYKRYKDKNDWSKSKKDIMTKMEEDDFMGDVEFDEDFDDDYEEDELVGKEGDFDEDNDELIFDENEKNESKHIKRFEEL